MIPLLPVKYFSWPRSRENYTVSFDTQIEKEGMQLLCNAEEKQRRVNEAHHGPQGQILPYEGIYLILLLGPIIPVPVRNRIVTASPYVLFDLLTLRTRVAAGPRVRQVISSDQDNKEMISRSQLAVPRRQD